MKSTQSIHKTLNILYKEYPDAKCSLVFANIWQLLVATMLSAQTKDVNVNKVTAVLFNKYASLNDLAKAHEKDIAKVIFSLGLYKTKARNIKRAAIYLQEKFNGNVPDSIDELIKTPGVARKTANVVMTEGFKKPQGIAVDTHVRRIANRLGWVNSDYPKKIEKDLLSKVGKKYWQNFTNVMISHGRKICKSQKPLCEKCSIKEYCKYYLETKQSKSS